MSPITEKSIGVDGTVFPERRSKIRHRCLRGATASFNKGYSVFECVAKNANEDGAKLSFGETFSLPNEFELQIAPEAERRRVRVAWRTMSTVGVKFL